HCSSTPGSFGLKKPRPSWLQKLLLLREYVILKYLKEKMQCNMFFSSESAIKWSEDLLIR
ncbi:hypothetical protein HGM15179_006634, partial [Zosterops borbonicus]